MTDTPDRRLVELRDWARSRADWQAGKPRVACANQTPFGRPKKPDHANCGGDNCGCECHDVQTGHADALARSVARGRELGLDVDKIIADAPDGGTDEVRLR